MTIGTPIYLFKNKAVNSWQVCHKGTFEFVKNSPVYERKIAYENVPEMVAVHQWEPVSSGVWVDVEEGHLAHLRAAGHKTRTVYVKKEDFDEQ